MPPVDGRRLFHAIVLMGVSLTGGAIASCGGGTETSGQTDAGGDAKIADGAYDGIRYNGDAYSNIGYNGDAHSHIGVDSSPGDAPYADISADGPTDAQDEPECYPCIAPAGGG